MAKKFLPVRVHGFDVLIEKQGFRSGDNILVSGGTGTGKTTFCMNSLINSAKEGEKCLYLTFEESAEKIRENLEDNYEWGIPQLEKQKKLVIVERDAMRIARVVEVALKKNSNKKITDDKTFDFDFKPDRIVVDSLSALSIAFSNDEEGYRRYLKHLFDQMAGFNSVNLIITETTQNPEIYSREGIEEFLADGVIVLYNVKSKSGQRYNALEILKLRSSAHVKKLVPYKLMGKQGFVVMPKATLFADDE
ncbi:MAG: Flp pilus assembly complex ATPase component TadA [Candidatus Diapherotrites archaeon]|nr:Flp pilus assembly complex ATPase component TadA [Candidatus Diapherotrites archaeon]